MTALLLASLFLMGALLALFWWRLRPYRKGRWTVFAVLFMLPWWLLPLYLAVGTPGALSPQTMPLSLEEELQRLRARLRSNPNDLQGWLLLARGYSSLGRWKEAASSYERALKLAPNDLNLKARYAEALAAAQGGFEGRARQLLEEVLQARPNHPYALWLAGLDALGRGEKARAVEFWRRLLAQIPPESEAAEQLRQLMARHGLAVGQVHPEAEIKVTVRIAPALRDELPEGATLLVFARAPRGPEMPLAVVRRPLAELPTTVTLSDRQALLSQFKLSQFEQVIITARISRSGQVKPQPGDLESAAGPVRLGEAVEVVIDRRLK